MNNNEPIILGKVKKGSTGKPLVAIILFLFIGAFILFLPSIINYFGDYNIMDLIKNGEIINFIVNHDSYIETPLTNKNNNTKEEKNASIIINAKTIIKSDKFTLNNFTLNNESIKFTINTNSQINFDETNYYLILSQNDKEITTIKLTDTIKTNKEFSFNFKEKLNNIVEVKGIIKIIRENEYPTFVVPTDESGLGSLMCKKDNYKIEYILNNNKLIRIKETLNYKDDGRDYINIFEKYSKITTKLNNANQNASITENYSGFIFTTDIDLSTYNNNEKNYNYYSLNTNTNKINFEMNAKGYDCI